MEDSEVEKLVQDEIKVKQTPWVLRLIERWIAPSRRLRKIDYAIQCERLNCTDKIRTCPSESSQARCAQARLHTLNVISKA